MLSLELTIFQDLVIVAISCNMKQMVRQLFPSLTLNFRAVEHFLKNIGPPIYLSLTFFNIHIIYPTPNYPPSDFPIASAYR